MKNLVASFFTVILLSCSLSAQDIVYQGKLAFLIEAKDAIRQKDTRLGLSLWVESLALNEDLNVEIEFYDKAENIVNDFLGYKFDYLAINPIFYLRNKRELDLNSQEFWVTQRSERPLEKMMILVRKDSGIKTLNDLKGKKVMTRGDSYMGRLYFETEVLRSLHKQAKPRMGTILSTKEYSTAILKTFFAKVDACIVPEHVFTLVSEMNPRLRNELVYISKSSEIFMPIISMFHNKTSPGVINAYKRNVVVLEQSVRGRNIMDLFKMKKLLQIEPKVLDPLKAYYDEYITLKQEYGDVYE